MCSKNDNLHTKFSADFFLQYIQNKNWPSNHQRIRKTRLESYNDPRPNTNQNISLKSRSLYLFRQHRRRNGVSDLVCFVHTYITYVRTYVCTYGRTPSTEIMNHFSSLCFGWCLGVDQKSVMKYFCFCSKSEKLCQLSSSSHEQTFRYTTSPSLFSCSFLQGCIWGLEKSSHYDFVKLFGVLTHFSYYLQGRRFLTTNCQWVKRRNGEICQPKLNKEGEEQLELF